MTPHTRDSVVAALRAFAAEHGYQPVSREAGSTYGLPSWHAVARIFGSWNAAIEAAGYRPYPARSTARAKTMAHRDCTRRAVT
jgi:hypothetical protein